MNDRRGRDGIGMSGARQFVPCTAQRHPGAVPASYAAELGGKYVPLCSTCAAKICLRVKVIPLEPKIGRL